MKKICITYHMWRADQLTPAGEFAESCIDLPIEDKRAKGILEKPDYKWPMDVVLEINSVLSGICKLQGYSFRGIASIEECRSEGENESITNKF